MIDLLILLFINSLLCWGFWNACYYKTKKIYDTSTGKFKESVYIKNFLLFIDYWADGKWFHKPLCGCLPCMASFHSIYPYWTYIYFTQAHFWAALAFYPVYILALSGLNYLINIITE